MQVYIIGEVGIEEELDLIGVPWIGGGADAGKKIELKSGARDVCGGVGERVCVCVCV